MPDRASRHTIRSLQLESTEKKPELEAQEVLQKNPAMRGQSVSDVPFVSSPNAILSLQRSIGNQAIQRMKRIGQHKKQRVNQVQTQIDGLQEMLQASGDVEEGEEVSETSPRTQPPSPLLQLPTEIVGHIAGYVGTPGGGRTPQSNVSGLSQTSLRMYRIIQRRRILQVARQRLKEVYNRAIERLLKQLEAGNEYGRALLTKQVEQFMLFIMNIPPHDSIDQALEKFSNTDIMNIVNTYSAILDALRMTDNQINKALRNAHEEFSGELNEQ